MTMLSETGSIIRLGLRKYATLNTPHAVPTTLPTKGGSITWTAAVWTDWTTLGNKDDVRAEDVGYFNEGDFAFTPINEVAKFKPPKGQANHHTIDLGRGMDEFSVPIFECGQSIFELDSYAIVDDEEVEMGPNPVYQSMIMEVEGIMIAYFPRVKTQIESAGGSAGTVMNATMRCIIEATSDIPSGMKRIFWADPE